MKLVDLLARELDEWPKSAYAYAQDGNAKTYAWTGTPEFVGEDWLITNEADIDQGASDVLFLQLASDYGTAVVTKKQWQAERDRQKGGEWKRHRGGKQPVADYARVECRIRNGDVETDVAGGFIWARDGEEDDIMSYRVIRQPQAGEVKLSKAEARAPFMRPLIVYPEATVAKVDQIDGPFKWRDTVNELNAYIEKFTRERDELIARLDSEGFALIPAMTPVMGFSPISLPFGEYETGDFVTSKVDYNKQFTKGKKYKVTGTNMSLGEKRVSLESDDKGKANGWLANQFEFHSRP